MPVQLPGFSSHAEFFSLFTPTTHVAPACWLTLPDAPSVELDERSFDEAQKPEAWVPFTEDCQRCLKQLISQYASLKQNELLFSGLLHCFPALPISFLNAAYSFYQAVINRQHIDIAILNALGLTASSLLADGNALARLAHSLREMIASAVGEEYLRQFLSPEENQGSGQLFTALAVLAIALKYWLQDSAAPSRRVLQLPAFLASVLIRAGYYWNQLGGMAQHAARSCLLPVENSDETYLCTQRELPLSAQAGLIGAQREAWECEAGEARGKPRERCDFAISPARLAQTKNEGVVFSRQYQTPAPVVTPQAASPAPRVQLATTALTLPLMLSGRGRTVGQAALGTSLVSLLGYAWYALSGRGSEKVGEPVALPQRADEPQTTPSAAMSRQAYWENCYQQTNNTAEKVALNLLKAGPHALGRYSLAAPRESFPLNDAWYTWMDRLNLNAFTPAFRKQFLKTAAAVARNAANKPPIARLPASKWLHLGRYYQQLYKKMLQGEAKAQLRLESEVSAQFQQAATQLGKLMEDFNEAWSGSAIGAKALKDLKAKGEVFSKRQAQLEDFRTSQTLHPAAGLKNEAWTFSNATSINALVWSNYTLPWLDTIKPAAFTNDFMPDLKALITSNVQFWTDKAGKVDLVNLYTGMHIHNAARLREALLNNDLHSAFNYAVLDAQLLTIIKQRIARHWKNKELDSYLRQYNKEKAALLPLTIAPPVNVTTPVPSVARLLNSTNWDAVREQGGRARPLKLERFNAEQYVLDKLKTQLNDAMAKVIAFAGSDILNPDRYIDKWIAQTLTSAGQEEKWSASSPIKVEYPGTSSADEEDWDGTSFSAPDPVYYRLRDVVRGVHRQNPLALHTRLRVDWPESFPATLRDRLENGISSNITQSIDSLFASGQPAERENVLTAWRLMARKTALNYLRHKYSNAPDSTPEPPATDFAAAVERYLLDKNIPYTLQWHGAPVSGVLFIPAVNAENRQPGDPYTGVLLSIWDGEYCEILSPGFAQFYQSAAENKWDDRTAIAFHPAVVVEQEQRFRDFINKHRTPRTGRVVSSVVDAFGYSAAFKEEATAVFDKTETSYSNFYYPPFTLQENSFSLDTLIDLQRRDLQDCYQNLIYTAAELKRATSNEMINALSTVASVLVMGGGILLGGPAWAWVAASMASTLFLDVVPHALLASQAESPEEREAYTDAVVMAIAFDVGGNIASEAAVPLLKNAVRQLARLGRTSFKSALPKWYQFTSEKLQQVAIKSGARPQYMIPPQEARALSQQTVKELDEIMASFHGPAKKSEGKVEVPDAEAGPSGAAVAGPSGVSGHAKAPSGAQATNKLPSLLARQEMFVDVAMRMRLKGFFPKYRAVTRWPDANSDNIITHYFITGDRNKERVVVQILTEGGEHSHLYHNEVDWLVKVHDAGRVSNSMIAFFDFDRPYDVLNKYSALGEQQGTLAVKDYPPQGYLAYVPESFKAKLSTRGVAYEEIQRYYERIRNHRLAAEAANALSTTIEKTVAENESLRAMLQEISLVEVPATMRMTEERDARVLTKLANIKDIGPDIERFEPLPDALPLMDKEHRYAKLRHQQIAKLIVAREGIVPIANDFVKLVAAEGAGLVSQSSLKSIETAFYRAYGMTEKLAALMQKARQSEEVRNQILVLLARFLNLTNPRILGEAYQRLDVLGERLYRIAHYHVMEQKFMRVVPMRAVIKQQTNAYVFKTDPTARIMVIVPRLAQQKQIRNILLHEMTHFAVGSEDFVYLQHNVKGYPDLDQHHKKFSNSVIQGHSPNAVLGRVHAKDELFELRNPLVITEYDHAVAQARVKYLPMVGAYAKMNNADSLVVLINALQENFTFRRKKPTGIEADAWHIHPAKKGVKRKPRAMVAEDDIFWRQYKEDVLACLFDQSLQFNVESIFTDDELELYDQALAEMTGEPVSTTTD